MISFTTVRVSGHPVERSVAYGKAAKDAIQRTKSGYERAFAAQGVSWSDATRIAQAYLPHVRAWKPELLDEIDGIATGSGLSFDDIFTLNCRTEVLWTAMRQNTPERAPDPRGECSTFALAPNPPVRAEALVGQNWDWLDTLSDTVIVLEVERDDGPNYVTIVEAGLLAKTSMNQAGIALAINTLVSSSDGHPSGVPFHFLIRALVDSSSVSEALTSLSSVERASSGNYVVGSSDGAVLNIETGPGDTRNVFPFAGDGKALVHTNHFLDGPAAGHDLAPLRMSDSYVRLARMRQLICDDEPTVTADTIKAALGDHTGAPSSICCHPDSTDKADDRWATLFGVVMEPGSRTLHLSTGNPCANAWQRITYADFLAAD
jgi:isopenicillin-N N-acyltransferase-like protein